MKKLTTIVSAILLSVSLFNVTVHAKEAESATCNLQQQNTMSVLWFQTAGETTALFHQGYNVGQMRLEELLSQKQKNKDLKPAVVLDLDETVLDNSPYQAWTVLTGKGYPEGWNEWVEKAEAKALPGSIEFLKYADSKGVEIFYISNRKETLKAATVKNLEKIGAPQALPEHVLLRQPDEKGKEARRQQVAKNHNILLLFGDNLGDFSGFDDLTATERVQAVEKREDEFGKNLIVFPNPMYGDWEGAIYEYNFKLSDEEKAKLRKENLQSFQP